MIVLPLTEESRSGRSVPWVTLALALACVAVFLHNRSADVAVDERVDAAIEDAWAYFEMHPYVKVDEDVAAMFGEEAIDLASQTFFAQARHNASTIPDFVRRHDQTEFDGRVERIYTELEGHSFFRLGFFPETLQAPDHTILTYTLVHEDWLHLASNLLVLILAGLFLEEVWGRTLFLLFVLSGAVAGAAGYALLDPVAADVLGGASGVSAALAGAFLVRFFTTRIRFQYFYIPPFGGRFTARGWVTLPLYGGLYLGAEYLLTQGAPGIEPVSTEFATWAHVGGLAWGAFFALGMKVLRIEERFIFPKMEEKAVTKANPLLERALEAREAGRLEEAFELLAGEVTRHPDNHDANLAYWDAAQAVGRPAQAADALLRVMRDEVNAGQVDLLVSHWRELTQRVPEARIEPAIEVRVAAHLIEQGEHDLAAFAVRRIVEDEAGGASAAMLHKVARMAQDLDTGLAVAAARRARAAKDLDPTERDEVDRLLEQLEGVSQRQQQEVTAGAAGGDTAGGLSGGPFGTGYDFQDAAPDPSERELVDEDVAPGVDVDGDTLNAPPFELDDLSEPPGVATYDLETADGDDTLDGLLEDSTVPPPEATRPPDIDAAAADPAPPPPREPAPRVPAPTNASPDPAAEADLEPDPDPHPYDPDLSDLDLSRPELDPDQHTLFPDTQPSLSLSGTAPPSPAATSPPLVAPDDEEIPLADDSIRSSGPLALDDTGAPDYGHTIDMEELGARTVQGLGLDDTGASQPDYGRTMDLADLGAQTLHGLGDDGLGEDVPAVEPLPTKPVPPPPAAEPDEPEVELPELSAPPEPRALKKMEAIPLSLGDEAITLDVGERGKAQLALERIDAVAVGGVRGLRPKPVVIIDLVTNWMGASGEPLKVVRLRSDRFDPRQLVAGEESGFQALKTWIGNLLALAEAVALPDADSAVGAPFRMFDDLESYEREVLRAG